MRIFILPLLIVLLMSINSIFSQAITGDTSVCIESYRYYTFPTNSNYTYTWQVTGGNIVDSHGDSVEIIWTTNVHGTITLLEK
ncbi:MAG: hypothetical protein LRY27_02480, partial [Chitinophagales bacterium]|nr:hypothetical protein [Chitinophagales bacterium]